MRRLGLAIAVCLSGAWPAAAAKAPAAPKDIVYARDSIEFAAIQREVYRWAWRAVRARAKSQKGRWAVVLDIDQTVLDNTAFQAELGSRPFSQAAWKAWTAKADAKALPGAKGFLDRVRALPRGEIVFMTDRGDDEAAATLKNLKDQGLFKAGDVLLTKRDQSDTKGARRACVEKALDPRCKAQGPRAILALFGDSARDFVELHGQDMETVGRKDILGEAGVKDFVLPNPMYGQWQNAYR